MANYLGLDRVFKAFRIIRQNGGIVASYKKLYRLVDSADMRLLMRLYNRVLCLPLTRMDEVKDGKLIGEDKYGNKYYENPYYFYGRNRWVEYAPHVHLEYDGSQIPAEWYGWMHYKVSVAVW